MKPHIGSEVNLLSSYLPWGVKWSEVYMKYRYTLIYFDLQLQFKYMNYFIYTSDHFTPHGRYELNKLISLPMCGFIAQLVEHRTGIAEVTGSNPVDGLIFFRLPLSSCLNWTIYCDDHSSLWSISLCTTDLKNKFSNFRVVHMTEKEAKVWDENCLKFLVESWPVYLSIIRRMRGNSFI